MKIWKKPITQGLKQNAKDARKQSLIIRSHLVLTKICETCLLSALSLCVTAYYQAYNANVTGLAPAQEDDK